MVTYGAFTDDRDGSTYRTVDIGGVVWMADNLRFDVGPGCCVYGNDARHVETYGRLYTWEAARRAVPAGFHLPTEEETKALLEYPRFLMDGGGRLKAARLWEPPNAGGTDALGFSALPAGFRDAEGAFSHLGQRACFWTGFETGPESALSVTLFHDYDRVIYTGVYDKRNACSVRGVKG